MFGNNQQNDIMSMAERYIKAIERRSELADTPVESSSSTDKLTVESMNNHVYFYAGVDTDRTLALIRQIRSIDDQLRNERDSRMLPDKFPYVPIWLHIQSNGGDLFAGLAMADQLSQIKSPVYSIVEGVCASAGTLISVSCTKRFILSSGYMLIHEFSNGMWGKHRDFVDEMKLQISLIDRLVQFYVNRTKVNKKNMREYLDHDSWFSAEESLKLGLVDEILR